MREGLLWYDDSPERALAEKIGLAAKRYRQKYGATPDICYVHSSVVSGKSSVRLRGPVQVQVATLPTVLRHHLWLGREEH